MALTLYNTLSRAKEVFKPITPKKVGLYHCGPTVYDHAHIGNLRVYVFADILRRVLEYHGYSVMQVINITDIGHLTSDADSGDDKMVKGLKRENLPLTLAGLRQLASLYETSFKKDLELLNIKTPNALPRATDNLKEEIELIQKLEEDGYAYTNPDGVYFDTTKVKEYGKLGGLTPLDEATGRIAGTNKKNPRDFVLWKLSGADHLGFESPWGLGFPGWHIECSAMARKYLGQPFDIHTGGTDHIPVHHNNEIAQSESAYNTPLANYWLHVAFLTIGDEKMAKSSGGFLTLGDLTKKHSPLAYRYLMLTSHYRSLVGFTEEALFGAEQALKRLRENISNLPESGEVSKGYQEKFESYIDDDLNTPKALALLWDLLKDTDVRPEDKKETALFFDTVFGLGLTSKEILVIPEEVALLLTERERARKNGDFGLSDALREKIKSLGYDVKDTAGGQKISKL